ncbi:MAG: polyamine aminopropyltransferase [Anaerolineae bacterium]|nr:MAG: polyamine aminopropyltransferase [Anaerolineae bacterium]
MPESWLNEELHPYYRKALKIEKMLVDEHTGFQHLQLYETAFFGKTLVLDGIIQLTERDNMGYHEMIVHVPMLAVPQARRVLIVGGGDGGSLEQVLKHASVQEAVVCELDRRVVDISREHFTGFGDPWADPRAELVIEDAFTYLARRPGEFDVIISDTTDPIGPAEKLFSDEFYELIAASLTPGGAAATQCEQPFFDAELIKTIYATAQRLKKNPAYYYAHIPTYPGGGIGFMYLSDTPWDAGLGKPYPAGLNYLNAEVHTAAFALPEFFRRDLYG